jgi:RND family efflux transporter MFP subunit
MTALMLMLLSWPLIGFSEQLPTATAELRELPREFMLDGTIEAVNRTTVSAQTSGEVEEILFDVDDYVEQGQLLIKLKDTQQKANLRQAEADLKEALARVQEALDEYNRVKELHAKKQVSQSMMDKAVAALKSARARQDAASAGLVQAGEQFDYTRIKAPYSGIVTERLVQVGEVASQGQRLMSGLSLDQLRVVVDVPQSLINPVREQGRAKVLLADGDVIETTSLTVFPYANQGSNSFTVRVDLPEGASGLFPGMFVKTGFQIGTRQVLVVPRQAVVYRSEVTAVYVVDEQGGIHFRRIRAGHPVDAEGMAVIAGLTEGEQVALDPIAAGAELKRQLTETSHE